MRVINPVDVLLWTFRRSPADVVRLYNALADVMRLATCGSGMNFGLWDGRCPNPLSAQRRMAEYFGEVAELGGARTVADVGSGMSGPASVWKGLYPNARIVCVDINRRTLGFVEAGFDAINCTSTQLPLVGHMADRVLALESAQHFRPLGAFTSEAARILRPGGVFCMAIPVAGRNYTASGLGLLWAMWSSEHYTIPHVRKSVHTAGFKVVAEDLVGSRVYGPLAKYYVDHRDELRRRITAAYPGYVESILHRSMIDMQRASRRGMIDYMVVKCRLE